MIRFSPEEERKAAYLSQVAQASILRVFEHASASNDFLKTAAADIKRFIDFISPFLEAPEPLPATLVSDERIRNAMQERLTHAHPSGFASEVDRSELERVAKLIEILAGGSRPNEAELLSSHEFLCRATELRIARDPLSPPQDLRS